MSTPARRRLMRDFKRFVHLYFRLYKTLLHSLHNSNSCTKEIPFEFHLKYDIALISMYLGYKRILQRALVEHPLTITL